MSTRLSEKRILAIMALKGQMTGTEVAEMFGINPATVYAIWCGSSYRNVTKLPKPDPLARGVRLKQLWQTAEYRSKMSEPMTKGQLNRWKKLRDAANDNDKTS